MQVLSFFGKCTLNCTLTAPYAIRQSPEETPPFYLQIYIDSGTGGSKDGVYEAARQEGVYYAQWYENGRQVRKSLETTVFQIAKQKLRNLKEGAPMPVASAPAKTPIEAIVPPYIVHLRARISETTMSSRLWVLGDFFGPVCEDLKTPNGRSRGRSKRTFVALPPLGTKYLEDISKAEVADFIAARITKRGIAPKTANRHREVLHALVNWTIDERDVRMPGGLNPIRKLKRCPVAECS